MLTGLGLALELGLGLLESETIGDGGGDGLTVVTAAVVMDFELLTTIGTAIAAAMPPATASPAMASKAINQPTLSPILAPTSPNHPSTPTGAAAYTIWLLAKGSAASHVPLT